jgi:chromate transporter
MTDAPAGTWKEIALSFLKIGATAYGGPAIMGVMQAELQEKRGWVSRARFLEGLSLVNVLPGATAVQFGIFLGYQRGGWPGGLLAGLCFAAPAFLIMLALTLAYATLGVSPVLRGALYGLGPVVMAIFIVALFRLGRTAMGALPHRLIAAGAVLAAVVSPLGTVAILLLAGGVGLLLCHSRRAGAGVLLALGVVLAVIPFVPWSPIGPAAPTTESPTLASVVALFATIGAFTFGGGLSMIPLMEEHVVGLRQWLTPGEFIAGLALGQLTPGPVLMVAVYVGYKLLGVGGALAAAAGAFLPSFVLMLAILPAFERVRNLAWTKAFVQGVAPAVIGVMAVALARLAPQATPDPFALVVLIATVAVLLLWSSGPLKAMAAGAVVGMLRSRLCELPAIRAVLCSGAWGR